MNVQVELFGEVATLAQTSRVEVEVPKEATVRQILASLAQVYPQHSRMIYDSQLALNRQYVDSDQLISQADEVALISPIVSVGTYASSYHHDDERSLLTWPNCHITDQPLPVQAAYDLLGDTHLGGTVLFVGTVRGKTGERETLYLEYEAYAEMALEQMRAIEQSVHEEHGDIRTLQWHRVGKLYPGEIAVICGAAAPHRPSAFVAARQLIDRLKKGVPIWKHEIYRDGQEVWQANPEAKS